MDICCELEKLPNLVRHYQEHKACVEDESFISFLLDDYLDLATTDDHTDDSSEDHSDLPFHGDHQCCHSYAFCTLIPSDFDFKNIAQSPSVEDRYRSQATTSFLESPFLPPRI